MARARLACRQVQENGARGGLRKMAHKAAMTEGAKMAQRGRHMAPGGLRDGPRTSQDFPRKTQCEVKFFVHADEYRCQSL